MSTKKAPANSGRHKPSAARSKYQLGVVRLLRGDPVDIRTRNADIGQFTIGEVRKLALGLSAPFFKNPPKNGEYTVEHASRVFALDKLGRLRAELYDVSPEAVVGLGKALLAE